MFDIDLINYNPKAPSFIVMLITALFAFFLSSAIVLTYEYTTKSVYKKSNFLQAISLISIVAATILQAIGESVAIGLGIIGALSIVRFRTALNDPRNMVFMFASLAVGIACGVKGFGIALTGTTIFCLGAIILRFSHLKNDNVLIGTLRLRVPQDDHFQLEIEQKLKLDCDDFELHKLRLLKKTNTALLEENEPFTETIAIKHSQEFIYLFRLKGSKTVSRLQGNISSIKGLEDLKINFQNQLTKL